MDYPSLQRQLTEGISYLIEQAIHWLKKLKSFFRPDQPQKHENTDLWQD